MRIMRENGVARESRPAARGALWIVKHWNPFIQLNSNDDQKGNNVEKILLNLTHIYNTIRI